MKFSEGARLTCTIRDLRVTDARLHREKGLWYICQNVREGTSCGNIKLGYKYSWRLSGSECIIEEVNWSKDQVYDIREYVDPRISHHDYKEMRTAGGRIYVEKKEPYIGTIMGLTRSDIHVDFGEVDAKVFAGITSDGRIKTKTGGDECSQVSLRVATKRLFR